VQLGKISASSGKSIAQGKSISTSAVNRIFLEQLEKAQPGMIFVCGFMW